MPRRVSFIERLNEYLGAASQDARLIVKEIVDDAVRRHNPTVQRAQAPRRRRTASVTPIPPVGEEG